jgi:hypothetical protein
MTDNVQHLNVKYLWKLIDVVFMVLDGYRLKSIGVKTSLTRRIRFQLNIVERTLIHFKV